MHQLPIGTVFSSERIGYLYQLFRWNIPSLNRGDQLHELCRWLLFDRYRRIRIDYVRQLFCWNLPSLNWGNQLHGMPFRHVRLKLRPSIDQRVHQLQCWILPSQFRSLHLLAVYPWTLRLGFWGFSLLGLRGR